MPIVSQGNSTVVQVGPTDGLWIKSTGVAEVTVSDAFAGSPEVINVTTDTARIGFYGEPVTVSIRAVSGNADYQNAPDKIYPLTSVQGGQRADSSPLDIAQTVNGLISKTGGVGVSTQYIPSIKNLPTTPQAGEAFNVGGYYAGTSFGGGDFVYDASKNKSDHNGGTVIAPEAIAAWDGTSANLSQILSWAGTGVGCFVKLFDGISVLDFGAAESAADNALAFNAAIKFSALNNSECLVPEGYFVCSQIRMPSKSKLVGCGKYITEIRKVVGSNSDLIILDSDQSVKVSVCSLSLIGNDTTNTAGSGVYFDSRVNTSGPDGFFSFITDVFIKDFPESGIKVLSPSGLEACVGLEIKEVTVHSCMGHNIYLSRCTDGYFERVVSAGSELNGIYLDQCANNKITACKTYYNKSGGWFATGGKRNSYSQCEAQEDFVKGVYMFNESFSEIDFLCDANGRIGNLGIGAELVNCSNVRGFVQSESFQIPAWQDRGVRLQGNADVFIELKNSSVVATPISVSGTANNNVYVNTGDATQGLYSGSASLKKVATLLNDQGTFTPQISFATPGTSNIVYSIQRGAFLKSGDFVTVQVTVTATVTKGTASGALTITGLPYSKLAGTPTAVGAALSSGLGAGVSSIIGIVGVVEGTGNSIIVRANKQALGWQSLTADNVTDGAFDFSCTIFYKVS